MVWLGASAVNGENRCEQWKEVCHSDHQPMPLVRWQLSLMRSPDAHLASGQVLRVSWYERAEDLFHMLIPDEGISHRFIDAHRIAGNSAGSLCCVRTP